MVIPTQHRRTVFFAAWLIGGWIGIARAGAEKPVSLTLSSEDTSVRVQIINDQPAVVSLVCRASGFDWVGGPEGAEPIPLIDAAEVGGQRRPLRWHCVRDAAAEHPDRGHTIHFVCDDPALELVSSSDAPVGPGPVEHRVTIRNRGREPVLLPVQPSLVLRMRAPRGHKTRAMVGGQRRGNADANRRHTRAIGDGGESVLPLLAFGPRRAAGSNPLDQRAGQAGPARVVRRRGVYGTRRNGDQSRCRPECVERDTAASAARASARGWVPIFYAGVTGRKLERRRSSSGAMPGMWTTANCLRRWVRDKLVPPAADDHYPLLVNNSWGGGMAVDERLARRMIDDSADLGIEMFHIDAGWFRAGATGGRTPPNSPAGWRPFPNTRTSAG